MDTVCVELKFDDGSMSSIAPAAVRNEAAGNMYGQPELDCPIRHDPAAYADLSLNGDPEAYLNNGTG